MRGEDQFKTATEETFRGKRGKERKSQMVDSVRIGGKYITTKHLAQNKVVGRLAAGPA